MNYLKDNLIVLSMLIFISLRLAFLFYSNFWVSGDDAVFGIMGKYIAEGKDFPVFMWGAHYAGVLSSYMFALLIKLFGYNYCFLKIGMVIFESIGVFFFALLFNYPLRFFVPLIMLFPPKYNFLVSSYVECFSLGFISYYVLKKNKDNKHLRFNFLGGGINGFGLYYHPIYFPFFVTYLWMAWQYGYFKELKRRLFCGLGFLLGFSPFIIYNFSNLFASIGRFWGLFLVRYSQSKSFFSLIYNFYDILGWFIFIILLSIVIMIYLYKKSNDISEKFRENIFVVMVIVSLLFYVLLNIQKSRYLMPFFYASFGLLFIAIEKLLGKYKKLLYIILLLLTFTSILTFLNFFREEKFYDYRKIVTFLRDRNIKYAYSNYWTAYPITFISNEDIIVSPRLNDKMGFYDRTPWYFSKVKKEFKKCVIIPSDLNYFYFVLKTKLTKDVTKFEYFDIDNFKIVIFEYRGDDSVYLI